MLSFSFLRPLLGLFACMLVLACSRQEPQAEPVRSVKLVRVGTQSQDAARQYAGDVRAQTTSRLGFQVAGKVQQRKVEVGDHVAAGTVLAQLDATDYALALQAAQAQVAAAQTQRDLAYADLQRYAALKDKGFISGVELDRRKAALKSAQAQLDQVQVQARAQQNQQGYTQLRAPHAGVITAVYAEPGQVMSAGTPVVELAHDGARDAVLAVPEQMLQSVRPGTKAQVQAWGTSQAWEATVREVAAAADPVTRTYQVKVGLQGTAQPALGSTVNVRLQLPSTEKSVLTLPSTAVMFGQRGAWVWVFDPLRSVVQARSVEVAGAQGREIVIGSGLEPGMQVVAAGGHLLSEGQQVMVYAPVDSTSTGAAGVVQ